MQTLIRPLLIKNISFPLNLIQGPLAGYSCWPMRLLATQYGHPAFCYTEMLSAKDLATRKNISPRFSVKHPDEGPLCIQLSGTDPEELKKATEKALQLGADLIDLNCGCPVAKIRQKGAGSKLLENPELLKKLVGAMKSVSVVPLSIKIRVDGDTSDSYSLLAAQTAENAGIDFITIHGRHWTESYESPCRQDSIAEIAEKLSIPVIANGDVNNTESALTLLKNNGAEGVMIARESVGQPWIFEQIRKEAIGEKFTPPTPTHIGELFLTHLDGLIEVEGEKIAVLQARKLVKYYARFLSADPFSLVLESAKTAENRKEMEDLVRESFHIKVFKN